jgi:putative methyltransferase
MLRSAPALRPILISEANASIAMPFLPYLWATLKTSAERVESLARGFVWLDPIYQIKPIDEVLAAYEIERISVAGLSSYMWNFDFNCALAKAIKSLNPNALMVLGGPHPDTDDPDFFRNHSYIDAVVKQDGEVTFNKILQAVLDGAPLTSISGLCVPSGTARDVVSTGPPELPIFFDRSPYVEQSAYFQRLLKNHAPATFSAIWETNRGCPYGCSFCDWGSNTMSKIRAFEIARVESEAEWLSRMNIRFLMMADANFGILPRDVSIAEKFSEYCRRHGGPQSFYFAPAKNNPARSFAVSKEFSAAGFSYAHSLAIQHTDPEVLAHTNRQNISAEKQISLARSLADIGVPIDVNLILGIPGDTYERWRKCFSDLMSWGIHDEYYVYFYHLLPNAPAAKPEFLARWDLETIDRRSRMLSYETKRGPDPLPRGKIVIGSRSFTPGDWVEMNAFSSFVRALHCHSLTRLIAIYLYSSHGIDYGDFYEMLVNEFMKAVFKEGSLYSEVTSMYVSCIETDKILDDVEMDETVWGSCVLSIPRWLIVEICSNLDQFFDDLADFLLRKMPTIANLQSIIDYQKDVVILPSYDCRVGKTFPIAHDWPLYFRVALKNSAPGALAEPAALWATVAHAGDTLCGGSDSTRALDWFSLEGTARRRAWIQRVVSFRTLAPSGNLQLLSFESAPQGSMRELAARASRPSHSYSG